MKYILNTIAMRVFLISILFCYGSCILAQEAPPDSSEVTENQTFKLYNAIKPPLQKLNYEIFKKGMAGFLNLKSAGLIEKDILTIIDISLSANKKRLWVIDLKHKTVLFHTLVSHGRNSGNIFAKKFSNKPKSYMSSMGFYITGATYYGKHGLSLYLDGMEQGFNDHARARAIVIHGASYVSEEFIRKYGRLGRSYGCPALPLSKHKKVIGAIKEKTCLFIYYPDGKYESTSELLKVPSNIDALILSYLE